MIDVEEEVFVDLSSDSTVLTKKKHSLSFTQKCKSRCDEKKSLRVHKAEFSNFTSRAIDR
jgi:hypothetical protein